MLQSRRAWLALCTLALAACSESALAPTPRKNLGGPLRSQSDQPDPFHSMSERYADNGAKPATGRSGSAAIAARALLGKDGVTTIEATTGQLDSPTAPPGQISKVQLKSVNGNGDVIQTVNFNHLDGGGYWNTTTSDLGRNAPIQIHANVGGIDGRRTDVVIATATVKLRPDLAVNRINAPGKAYINTPVIISALVLELNGDVGARDDCLLFVDGVQVDQIPGMWVDAGSAVTCAFVYSFPATGTHTLKVQAANVVPADWDLANNEATASIEIVLPIVNLNWSSGASAAVGGNSTAGTYFYGNCNNWSIYCDGFSQNFSNGNDNRSSDFWFYAYTYQTGIAMPASVAFTATTNSSTLAQMQGSVGSANLVGCTGMYDIATSTNGYICNWGGSFYAYFSRYGGSATYYSYGYQYYFSVYPRYCSNGFGFWYICGSVYQTYNYSSWSYNSGNWYGYGPFGLGRDIAVSLTLTDATGLKFVAGGSYGIVQQYSYNETSPYSCHSWTNYYSYSECRSSHSYGGLLSGYASGFGMQ